MTPRPNTLIATSGENIFKVYDQVRSYILDKEAQQDFDQEMDLLEDNNETDDAEDYFEEQVLDYLNENISPPGTLFGINADSGEIGFWEEELIGEEFDPDEPSEEFEENPEEDDDELPETESKEQILETLLRQEDVRRARSREEGVEERGEGQAEVLDDSGEVVTTTTFKTAPTKVVCLSCGKVIGGDPEASEEKTTRGICESCKNEDD